MDMRWRSRAVAVLASLLMVDSAKALDEAMDQDTICATVYSFLADSARKSGMSSDGFMATAIIAQNYHMASYPMEDPQRYSLSVIDGAQMMKDAVSQGTLSTESVISTAKICALRYAVH
jgi:hypothetical protein